MRKRIVVEAVFLAALLLLASSRQAHAEQSNIRLPAFEMYSPAKVVVSFAYTKNVTVQVSTLKTSLYKATTSPTQIEFEASDMDLYSVNMKIYYENLTVRQTVQIGMWEGDRPVKVLEFDVASQGLILDLKISVVKQPRFPTADELGEVLWRQWHSELASFEANQQKIITGISDTVTTIGSLAAIAFGLSVALTIAVFHVYRKTAELAERGIGR